MKYQNVKSFKKHLMSAFPDHLCRVYLIVVSNDYEQRKILEGVAHLMRKGTELSLSRYRGGENPLDEVLGCMLSPSLLGGEPLAILDQAELLKKSEIQELGSFFKKGVHFGRIILGGKSKGSLSSVYQAVEKNGVLLDLSGEKSWEKERRFSDFIIDKLARAKKSIPLSCIEVLFDRVGLDMAALEQEVEKLITYVGERPSISLKDIRAVCSSDYQTSNVWELAEQIVWERQPLKETLFSYQVDPSFFHSFVAALRHQLHMGYQLASLLRNKASQEEISSAFPKVWPKTLEKRKSIASACGSAYFRKALLSLFEIDLLSKNSATCLLTLIDLFRAKLKMSLSHEP